MKKYRLFLCILLILGYGYFVYLIVYQKTYDELKESKLYDENALSSTVRETTAAVTATTTAAAAGTAEAAPVIISGREKERVDSGVVYILESYELSTGRYSNEILPLPLELMGMTAEELHGYYLEKEFLELVVFENNILVVRKLYDESEPAYEFKLVAEKNSIVVYNIATGEKFADTDINLQDLPYGLKMEIQSGKLFKNESELYYFLESYSS